MQSSDREQPMRLFGKSLAAVSYAALAVLYFAFIIVGIRFLWQGLSGAG